LLFTPTAQAKAFAHLLANREVYRVIRPPLRLKPSRLIGKPGILLGYTPTAQAKAFAHLLANRGFYWGSRTAA
jgi:hypothetical protein